jgi:Na+-transporting NADH:ubiquinone oxidoreductase subunit F
MILLLNTNLLIIILSVVMFLAVMLMLVGVLLYARHKLVPSGPVKVMINKDRILEVNAGGTLLNTLSEQGIFLPSACGGGGTCAVCRCQVLDGAGDILPTEVGYFTRKEIQEKWRLACQVKVKQDVKIHVPEEIFGIKKWECEVVSNRNVATFIKEFVVRLPEGEELDFQSGGYIQIDVPTCEVDFKDIEVQDKFRGDWDQLNMWDLKMVNPEPINRAYSMANHPAEGNIIKLNIRIATPPWDREKNRFMNVNPGICSSYVFSRKPGDKVTISGPYGEFFIKDTDKEMVYIGGGAGMAPLRSHIFHLFHTLKPTARFHTGMEPVHCAKCFMRKNSVKLKRSFPILNFILHYQSHLPEDNWTGYTGFIHQVVLDNYLSKHPEPEEVEYYLCGPPIMNESVLKMLDNLGVPDENVDLDDFGG